MNKTIYRTFLGVIIAAGMIAIVILAVNAGNRNEQEIRDLCVKLHAEFVSDPNWMCIKDGEIVYGDKDR